VHFVPSTCKPIWYSSLVTCSSHFYSNYAAISIPLLQLSEVYVVIIQGLHHVLHCGVGRVSTSKGDVNKHWKGVTDVWKSKLFITAIEYPGRGQTTHWWTLHISLELSGFRHYRCSQSVDTESNSVVLLTGWHMLQRNYGKEFSTLWQWLLLSWVLRKVRRKCFIFLMAGTLIVHHWPMWSIIVKR
jgi:hypothetical protein